MSISYLEVLTIRDDTMYHRGIISFEVSRSYNCVHDIVNYHCI